MPVSEADETELEYRMRLAAFRHGRLELGLKSTGRASGTPAEVSRPKGLVLCQPRAERSAALGFADTNQVPSPNGAALLGGHLGLGPPRWGLMLVCYRVPRAAPWAGIGLALWAVRTCLLTCL